MTNPTQVHFSSLIDNYNEVVKQSFQSKHEKQLSEMFQFSEDLIQWYKILSKHTDTTLLSSALQEYELGFQAAVSGQYRYAYVSNRYFIEQVCKFIYLSSNEFHLRQWKAGYRDISWNAITDPDSGIFSTNYIRAFYSEVDTEGKHILLLVSTLYRESSEFVHGNFSKINVLPNKTEFKEDLLGNWLDNVKTAKFIVLFLLCMRFSKNFNKEEIEKLEDSIREELCGIVEFNLLFD